MEHHLRHHRWGSYEPWQIDQLAKIGVSDPGRLGALLCTLWRHHPDLLEEVVWSALEDGSLDAAAAERWLGTPRSAIEAELSRRQKSSVDPERLPLAGR
ncbi:MAG: hypothetical protein SNJ74_05850 [Fimbriimonadaceae bacterium]